MRNLLNIVRYPSAILLKKARQVDHVNKELRNILRDMVYTMNESDGIGLAANQVNLDIAIFVMSSSYGILKVINPKITPLSDDQGEGVEGCLSLPGEQYLVKRYNAVKLEYTDINNKVVELDLYGLDAICAQHEYDHLNGILINKNKQYIEK